MTKGTLLASAVLAMAGTVAQAQNVTVFGVADLAVERLNHVGAAGDTLIRMPGLTGSVQSRLGVRGTEDLGGGLKAVFAMEMGIALDSGAFNQGGRAWGRQAHVGLQGDWGTVSVGRQYSMLFWPLLDTDIVGPNAYSSGSLDSYLPNARVDNSIAYRGAVGGVSFGATYSLGRDTVNAGPSPGGTNCPGERASDSTACRQWSAMAKYDAADWGIALAVDEFRGGAGAFAGLTSSAMRDRRSLLAGWARFGKVKFGAGLIARKNDAGGAAPKSDLWYLGAAYHATPLVVIEGEWFRLDYKNSVNRARLLALRASYLLSKRTALYVTTGQISNAGTLSLSASGAAAGGAPVAGGSQTGIAAGIRHTF